MFEFFAGLVAGIVVTLIGIVILLWIMDIREERNQLPD